jgi:hypothetical protein
LGEGLLRFFFIRKKKKTLTSHPPSLKLWRADPSSPASGRGLDVAFVEAGERFAEGA